MSDDPTRDDIRKLLKTFGVGADEAIMEYLAIAPGDEPLRLRVTLEDVSTYNVEPDERLYYSIEAEVRR